MKHAPPKAVAFDLDGLLFNTEQLYPRVLDEVLQRRGLRYTEDLVHQMMGRPGPVALQIMVDHHQLPDSVPALMAECDVIFRGILETDAALMPGVLNLLDKLEHANFPKAIATSSHLKYVEWLLSRFDLKDRFRFLLTAEDVTHGKPNPEIYLKAAEGLKVQPSEMLVLEDSQNGCKAAVAAGTIAVAVPGEHSAKHDFTGARLIASSLVDPRLWELLGIS